MLSRLDIMWDIEFNNFPLIENITLIRVENHFQFVICHLLDQFFFHSTPKAKYALWPELLLSEPHRVPCYCLHKRRHTAGAGQPPVAYGNVQIF